MTKTVHSVKLIPYDSVDLDRLTYSNGDVVFDNTQHTLRLMDGITQGGEQLATHTWVTALQGLIPVSHPTAPVTGQLAISNGTTWNPASDAQQHLQIFLNGVWVQVA